MKKQFKLLAVFKVLTWKSLLFHIKTDVNINKKFILSNDTEM